MLPVAVLGVIGLMAVAYGLVGPRLASDPPTAETGRLDVDGVTYTFVPTTCTITESDFVAAGSGRIDDQAFWVSASRDGVDLAIGPESQVDQPDENQVWLSSVQAVEWEASDGSITATALMADERQANSRHFRGSLSVECSAAERDQQASGR